MTEPSRERRASPLPLPDRLLGCGIHFGFRVRGDLDAYCDELKRKGVVFSIVSLIVKVKEEHHVQNAIRN